MQKDSLNYCSHEVLYTKQMQNKKIEHTGIFIFMHMGKFLKVHEKNEVLCIFKHLISLCSHTKYASQIYFKWHCINTTVDTQLSNARELSK